MPKIRCEACQGSGKADCSQCFGHGAVMHPYQGALYCTVCQGKQKTSCISCNGSGKIQISQELFDLLEEERRQEEKVAQAAREKLLSGKFRLEATSQSLHEFIDLARKSGLSDFQINAKGAELVYICETLRRNGIWLHRETEDRYWQAVEVEKIKREIKREELEKMRRQAEQERADKRRLEEEQEAARREEAARERFNNNLGCGAKVFAFCATAGVLYSLITTPSAKSIFYKPRREAINAAFKGTRYSVVHGAGYSLILNVKPGIAKAIAGKPVAWEISGSPAGTYPIEMSTEHIEAIVFDTFLTGKYAMQETMDSVKLEESFNDEQIKYGLNIVSFYKVSGSSQEMQSLSMQSSSTYEVAKKLEKVLNAGNFQGVRTYIHDDKPTKYPEIRVYFPENRKFDLISGKVPAVKKGYVP